MRRLILSALLAGAALAPAAALTTHATAAQPAKGVRACFHSDDIRNFRAVDDRTVNLLANGHDVFQLKTLGDCPDLKFANSVGVKTVAGDSFVCDSLDIDLITPSPVGPRTCNVTGMREMSPQEVAALPKNQQP